MINILELSLESSMDLLFEERESPSLRILVMSWNVSRLASGLQFNFVVKENVEWAEMAEFPELLVWSICLVLLEEVDEWNRDMKTSTLGIHRVPYG